MPWGELERPWDGQDDPDQPSDAPDADKSLRMRREPSRKLLDTPDTNNIGRSEIITVGGRAATLVNLKDGTDDTAMVMSICFAELQTEGNVPVTDPVATAIVEWGTGGLQSSAEVDFIKGTVINVVAAFIRVSARHDGAEDDGDMRAGAFVSYLPSRSVIAPKRTLRQLTDLPIAVGTLSDLFPIPNFAGKVTIQRVPFTASFVFRFLNQAGVIIVEEVFPSGISFIQSPLEVPNDARFVQILNIGPDDAITQLRFVFWLFL